MPKEWSELVREAIAAMKEGEAVRARERIEELRGANRSFAAGDGTALSSVWEPFLGLLHRRGYFVSSPIELGRTLEEIFDLGPGFDLHDLAASLAACDADQARRLQVPESRGFPELRPFAREESRGGFQSS